MDPQSLPNTSTEPSQEIDRITIPNRKFTTKIPTSLLVGLIMILGLGAVLVNINRSQDIRKEATNTGPVLALNPSTKIALTNETYDVGILLHTNDATVSAVQLRLQYDPTALQILGYTNGSAFPVVLSAATYANGIIATTLGVSSTAPFHGSTIIGTLQVKTLATKASAMQFMSDTIVASLGKTTNTLAASTGLTISVASTTVPTATPAHTATPTPSRTPTPTSTHAPTSTPTATQIRYIISNDMCTSVTTPPANTQVFTTLAACIGALNALIATPTTTPSVSPTVQPTAAPTATPTQPTSQTSNAADIDRSGDVNIIDFTLYMSAWFLNNLDVVDLNDDGRKSAIDYTIFMNGWWEYLH